MLFLEFEVGYSNQSYSIIHLVNTSRGWMAQLDSNAIVANIYSNMSSASELQQLDEGSKPMWDEDTRPREN